MDDMANKSLEYITWYLSMDNRRLALSNQECMYHFYLLDEITKSLEKNGSSKADNYSKKLDELYGLYAGRTGITK